MQEIAQVSVSRTVEALEFPDRVLQQPVEELGEKFTQVPVQRNKEVPQLPERVVQRPVEQFVDEIAQVLAPRIVAASQILRVGAGNTSSQIP